MITITTRPYSESEKASFKPSKYRGIEHLILMFAGILMVMLLPFLALDHFFHLPFVNQAWFIILLLIADASIIITFIKKQRKRVPKKTNIDDKIVEILHVKTNRAVRREDPEDFGAAFYLDVYHQGKQKTLFLWGQYLDILDRGDDGPGSFPNTEFELMRDSETRRFIDIRLLGTSFESERTLPAFEKKIWQTGAYPQDGDLLDQSIDEIT